jgi:hypothetical protein
MVTAPIVLLLAVTPNPGGISMARDAATACLDSLPAEARSIVRVAPVAPQDSEVIAETSGSGAAAVVILSWHDASLLTTEVRVFVVSPQDGVTHWITRTIVFSARDLASERGRALGLVIASVLDESWGIEALARAEPPAPVVAGLREAGRIEDQPVSVVTRVEPLEFPTEPPRWALEANVTTAVDHVWDVDDSIGGMVGLRRLLSSRWALRTGLGFRVADIDGANATGRTALGAMGVVWTGAGSERPKAFNSVRGSISWACTSPFSTQRGGRLPRGPRATGPWAPISWHRSVTGYRRERRWGRGSASRRSSPKRTSTWRASRPP